MEGTNFIYKSVALPGAAPAHRGAASPPLARLAALGLRTCGHRTPPAGVARGRGGLRAGILLRSLRSWQHRWRRCGSARAAPRRRPLLRGGSLRPPLRRSGRPYRTLARSQRAGAARRQLEGRARGLPGRRTAPAPANQAVAAGRRAGPAEAVALDARSEHLGVLYRSDAVTQRASRCGSSHGRARDTPTPRSRRWPGCPPAI